MQTSIETAGLSVLSHSCTRHKIVNFQNYLVFQLEKTKIYDIWLNSCIWCTNLFNAEQYKFLSTKCLELEVFNVTELCIHNYISNWFLKISKFFTKIIKVVPSHLTPFHQVVTTLHDAFIHRYGANCWNVYKTWQDNENSKNNLSPLTLA